MSKIIYLPGWLNTGKNLRPLADLTGGESLDLPVPDRAWSVNDYADWAAEQITEPSYVAGHSFGGKIALAAAARHPEKVLGIFIVAGSNRGRLIFRLLRPLIKIAKWMRLPGRRFQTADYKNSPPAMREVMKKTLAFDIVPLARKIQCPAAFIYGSADKITPPKLGRRLARETPGAKFHLLNGFGHNTIITDGAWQAAAIIKSLARDIRAAGHGAGHE
ncbi:MAG: alpha/beta fold hydrolase [Rickettsiales bacterium]|jgi:pimeloyl-ACP methyl ester carboxylesterase|nr:alpha/beta fold hydrolase [Rickettsiales bacterium]